MVAATGIRSAISWMLLGLVGGVGVWLAVILVAGVSVAEEAGQPLGVDIVTVNGTTPPAIVAPAAPGPDGTVVVPGPAPTEVSIDDDADDDSDNSGSGGGGDDSDGDGGDDSDDD